MQGKQDPLPSVGVLDPGRHFKHVVGRSAPPRYSPSPQFEHAVADNAPISVPFFPGWQSMQVSLEVAPIALEYVPALHGEHLISASRPSSTLNMPAGHPVHAGCFSSSLYLPSLHFLHSVASVPPLLYPAGQTVQSEPP
jgi:hypothetical protein